MNFLSLTVTVLFTNIVGVFSQTDEFSFSVFLPPGYEEVSSTSKQSLGALDKCGTGKYIGRICVPYHQCSFDYNSIIKTEIRINVRAGGDDFEKPCEALLDVCCGQGEVDASTLTPPTPIEESWERCGIRNENGTDFQITGNYEGEAEYTEFPWMVAVMRNEETSETANENKQFLGGGSLIASNVVLTGGIIVYKMNPEDIKIRAGEWDTLTLTERSPYQERGVERIIIHEKFHSKTLFNDVALLILQTSLNPAKNVATVCLPQQGIVASGSSCFATGWGKDKFGSTEAYQNIMKKIELPIISHGRCEKELRKTRLGTRFNLDKTFICAGGQIGKDTCEGDGGGPLVCPDKNQPKRYVQTGIVAWGIGCQDSIPGVYADVANFKDWIDNQLQALGISDNSYTI